ncbi:hypothetical protein BVY01_01080 [bacterium I07]|nr:hypothetical protein BVY01_01080 [bacterium I07]
MRQLTRLRKLIDYTTREDLADRIGYLRYLGKEAEMELNALIKGSKKQQLEIAQNWILDEIYEKGWCDGYRDGYKDGCEKRLRPHMFYDEDSHS